jgi:hypothetical protein
MGIPQWWSSTRVNQILHNTASGLGFFLFMVWQYSVPNKIAPGRLFYVFTDVRERPEKCVAQTHGCFCGDAFGSHITLNDTMSDTRESVPPLPAIADASMRHFFPRFIFKINYSIQMKKIQFAFYLPQTIILDTWNGIPFADRIPLILSKRSFNLLLSMRCASYPHITRI